MNTKKVLLVDFYLKVAFVLNKLVYMFFLLLSFVLFYVTTRSKICVFIHVAIVSCNSVISFEKKI